MPPRRAGEVVKSYWYVSTFFAFVTLTTPATMLSVVLPIAKRRSTLRSRRCVAGSRDSLRPPPTPSYLARRSPPPHIAVVGSQKRRGRNATRSVNGIGDPYPNLPPTVHAPCRQTPTRFT